MTNKERLKKAIVDDFNGENNYKEISKKIEKEREMKKGNNLLKWALIPLCLVVIISGIILLTNKRANILQKKPYSINNTNNSNYNNYNNYNLNINDLDKTDLTSLDADIKTVSGVNIPYPFKVNEDGEEFIIPKDLTQIKNYIVYTKKDKDSKEYDEIVNYIIDITNGSDRSIVVKYAMDQDPIRDYYFSEENSKITTINDIDLKIYKYGKSFYTIFSYNGYNFDIETSNITEDEFTDYLISILR